MPTRSQLLKLADEAAASAAEHGRLREMMLEQERQLRAMAESTGTNEVLHKRLRSASVNERMDLDHRLAISEGQGKADEAFRKAIRAKNYTQNKLAKAVGINQAVLSLHRQKLRRIPLSRAKDIERLTGWPADAKHWPCGIVTDGE